MYTRIYLSCVIWYTTWALYADLRFLWAGTEDPRTGFGRRVYATIVGGDAAPRDVPRKKTSSKYHARRGPTTPEPWDFVRGRNSIILHPRNFFAGVILPFCDDKDYLI